jgi:delta-1-pyrroline-5-carboxylate synthetase
MSINFLACNAMETLLLHEDLFLGSNGLFFNDICNMLKEEGVTIYSGPKLNKHLTFGPPPAKTMKHEYGALECCVEIVKDLDDAVAHIQRYGSSHTVKLLNVSRAKLTLLASSTTLHLASLTVSVSVWALKLEFQPQEFTLAAQLASKDC